MECRCLCPWSCPADCHPESSALTPHRLSSGLSLPNSAQKRDRIQLRYSLASLQTKIIDFYYKHYETFFYLLLPLHKFRRQVMMQLFFLHMCGLNSHAILQHVDIAGLPINYNETQLLDIKRLQVPTTTSTRHEHGGKQQRLRSLPVSVKDWMSQVKSIFTQSELSSFLKLIPMNHMETNSFLWKKSIKICYKFASSKGQLSSLYTVYWPFDINACCWKTHTGRALVHCCTVP